MGKTGKKESDRVTFDSGAQRSKRMPRYDLLPMSPLMRIAARFEMGLKYGEHNYKLGLPFDDTFNHVIDHLLTYRERRKRILQAASEKELVLSTSELRTHMRKRETDGDDLAAAAWGLIALMYLEDEDRLL